MEPSKELTNVTFDEIKVGATAELTVTLTQNHVDGTVNILPTLEDK